MRVRRLVINFNFISIAIAVLVFAVIGYSVITRDKAAAEVSLDKFVTNLKANEYAIVDVRGDDKALATKKYVFSADFGTSVEFAEKEDLKVSASDKEEFETISMQDLLDKISPVDFRQFISQIRNAAEPQITQIYVGEEFVIASTKDTDDKDYLVTDGGETEFNALLEEKNKSAADYTKVSIHYLRTALREQSEQEFSSYYEEGKFANIWVLDTVALASLQTDHVAQEYLDTEPIGNLVEFLQREEVDIDGGSTIIRPAVIAEVPWGDLITIGILAGFAFLAITMIRGIQGSGNSLVKFGQSKARMLFGKKPDVRFKDVAGITEAKEELREIVMFLKDPQKFLKIGARIPKGVLLVGAPGTGKTLLARAIAGEAGVPFFHTSGSEFEEMLVGAGASRVRDLFEKAKKAAPAIIFIDEIDAVARKRGTTIQSGTTEQTLNQILVEMDGFEKNTNVIVIAATNRPDVLDTAILRPGRFDRRVVLDLPDVEGRKEIIALHTANKPMDKTIDMERIARRTVGFTGADIENMLNEAAIIVAKANRKEITFNDIEEAANKVQIGPARKRKRSDKELKMTAYHEAGHALVMKLAPEHDPVHRVTIVSRGMALGYTMPLPEADEVQMSKTKMLSKITSLVAGFATEELIFGDVTSGASNDIEKASDIARKMVKNFGMSKKLGLVKYGQEEDSHYLGYSYEQGKNYSDDTAKIIDEEVKGIINTCYEQAVEIISKHKGILDKIVEALLEKEVLDADEFEAFFK